MGTRRSRWTISATWLIYGLMPWTFLFRHMGTARIAKGERPIASWSDQRKRLRLARCSSLRPLGVRADHYRWSVRERRALLVVARVVAAPPAGWPPPTAERDSGPNRP